MSRRWILRRWNLRFVRAYFSQAKSLMSTVLAAATIFRCAGRPALWPAYPPEANNPQYNWGLNIYSPFVWEILFSRCRYGDGLRRFHRRFTLCFALQNKYLARQSFDPAQDGFFGGLLIGGLSSSSTCTCEHCEYCHSRAGGNALLPRGTNDPCFRRGRRATNPARLWRGFWG